MLKACLHSSVLIAHPLLLVLSPAPDSESRAKEEMAGQLRMHMLKAIETQVLWL